MKLNKLFNKYILSQTHCDWIGRKIYYIISFYISFMNIFYHTGNVIKQLIEINKIKNIYFPSNNPIYSFIRGFVDIDINYTKKVIKIDKDNIKFISIGDTNSKIKCYLDKLKYDIMIHTGDICYNDDKINLIKYLDSNKNILVTGCREVLSNNYQKMCFLKIIKCRNFSIKFIIIHNYVFFNSQEYYNIIQFLKETKNKKTNYTVILSHCPPYSVSRHGSDYIIQSMLNLSKIDFDIYLSGHEHCYMRFDINNKKYIVNGLGGHSKYNFYDENKYLLEKLEEKYNQLESVFYLDFNSKYCYCYIKNINNELIDKFSIKCKNT